MAERAEPEWPQTLDVRRELQRGWRPTPFQEFVLKVHSRCNLACDYCYMYEMADQGWQSQPRRMSKPVIDRVARRIAEHAESNMLREVGVTLHGGEPLLATIEYLRYAIESITDAVHTAQPDIRVGFTVQTNGVLLNEAFLDLFAKYGVYVGVSLDGDEEGHDRHRKRANGHGSHRDVMAGMELLKSPSYRDLFTGFLATIDLRNDPMTTYEALIEHRPPGVDFLLPHGNWETPPPGRPVDDDSTPYADWLIPIFDRWYHHPGETRVRLFLEILSLLTGRYSRSEAIGLSPVSMVVVETNGQIEQVDTLKSAFEGAAGTALHVSRDPFNAALMLPSIVARQIGVHALSDTCRACSLHRVCGGGHYTHRYRPGTGFRNPSVFCADLQKLIRHVRAVVGADVETRQAAEPAPRDRSRGA